MSQSRLSIIPSRAIADPDLTATQLRVLGAIGSFTGKEQSAYPKQSTLAELLGIARETVNRAVKALAKSGYIEVQAQRRADGGQAANLYFVKLDPCDATITPPVTVGITPPVTPAVTPNRTIHINDTNSNELVCAEAPKQTAELFEIKPRSKGKKRGPVRQTQIPKDWRPSEMDIAYAAKHKLSPEDIENEATRFHRHFKAKGTRWKDWHLVWCNWLTGDYGIVTRRRADEENAASRGFNPRAKTKHGSGGFAATALRVAAEARGYGQQVS